VTLARRVEINDVKTVLRQRRQQILFGGSHRTACVSRADGRDHV
jgi:hypothetical protein